MTTRHPFDLLSPRLSMSEPGATFETGPANPQSFSVPMSLVPSFDVIEVLPERAADWLRALRQHVQDLHALCAPFEEIHEASNAKLVAEARLRRLTDHQQNGGFNLKPDDPRVIEQQRLLDKLVADQRRLNELNETRSAAWREAGYTLQAVEGWLRNGVPGNCQLQEVEAEPPKLNKGESLMDAIERLRRRVRELRADLHRIESAPFPSSHAKQRMREAVSAMAMQGEPSISDLVEHKDGKIVWPTQRVQSEIFNTGTPAIGFAVIEATTPLLVWLHADLIIKRLDALVDAEADDPASLSHTEREKRESEVQADMLDIERQESCLVWQARAQNLPCQHRSDCAPQAILQVRLVAGVRR